MIKLPSVSFLQLGIPGLLTPRAVAIHVTKHHQAYVDTANKLISGTQYERKSIEDIIKQSEGPIFNNVAQHYNHSFFWNSLSSSHVQLPNSVKQIFDKKFGGVKEFQDQFIQKVSTIFGSGWCFLAKNSDGSLSINQYSNALNPVKNGGEPLLACDAWEHTWYVDYENRKGDFFNKFFNHVNWNFVEERFKIAKLI